MEFKRKLVMKLFYCDINNFGDELNKYIFKKCFNITVEYADFKNAEAMGIGSILDNALLSTKNVCSFLKRSFSKKSLLIMSSGFGWENEYYQKRIRYFKSLILLKKIQIISLRGKLTLNKIEKIFKHKIKNPVLGDLGLLASYLIEDPNIKKIYDLGICPHYADVKNPILQKIRQQNPNSIILNTRTDPIQFLQTLSKCKTIISTGLHPLIAADSLGIPNLWVRLSEKTTSKYKFLDYYSIYDLNLNPINLSEFNTLTVEKIQKEYKIDNNLVNEIKKNLFKVYSDFFENFNR